MTLAGVPQVSPAGVDVETVKDAVPLPVAVTVIVEVPAPPGDIWVGDTAPAVTDVMVNVGGCTTTLVVPVLPV